MHEGLSRHTTKHAKVEKTQRGFCLKIPSGNGSSYRLAQLDEYGKLPRRKFPRQPSLRMSLRARVSAAALPGTWGFGLWNDPFGFSFGFGGDPLRLPALPNAVWFFHASQENYLSFGDNPGSGFLAQVFKSPAYPFGRLAKVGMVLPFNKVKARAMLGKIVEEAGLRIALDETDWHSYSIEWTPSNSAFWVDGIQILETSFSPQPPLGVVIWIDNQYAAFTPSGKIGFGVLENTEPAWLEIENLDVG
jgi:hypothetical protein